MVPQKFEDMEMASNFLPIKVSKPQSEPYYYLPVFDTWEAAVSWNNSSEEHILEVDWQKEKEAV